MERLVNEGRLGEGITAQASLFFRFSPHWPRSSSGLVSQAFFPSLTWPPHLQPYHLSPAQVVFFVPLLDPNNDDSFNPVPVMRSIPSHVTVWRRICAIVSSTTLGGVISDEDLASMLAGLELEGRAASPSFPERKSSISAEVALSRAKKAWEEERLELLVRIETAETQTAQSQDVAKAARSEVVRLTARVVELEEGVEKMSVDGDESATKESALQQGPVRLFFLARKKLTTATIHRLRRDSAKVPHQSSRPRKGAQRRPWFSCRKRPPHEGRRATRRLTRSVECERAEVENDCRGATGRTRPFAKGESGVEFVVGEGQGIKERCRCVSSSFLLA